MTAFAKKSEGFTVPQRAVTGSFTIEKADDEQQMLFGWANIAVAPDGHTVEDSHGEQIAADDLEHAAYGFVLKSRVSGEDHDGGPVDGVLVESVMFTDEKLAALAIDPFDGVTVNEELAKALADHMHRGWWVGFHIADEEAWDRTKKDKTEFSIEGTARYA